MKIGFLITARLKSSRLPLKLLLDLNGQRVVERVIERAKSVAGCEEVVLCTSYVPQDKPLVEIAQRRGIFYFIGDPDNVMRRLLQAALFFGLGGFVGITADNPLFSIYHAELIADLLKREQWDYIYTSGMPVGVNIYGVRTTALQVACKVAEDLGVEDTEIWGVWINQPQVFRVKEIRASSQYQRSTLKRLTLDEMPDYELFREIFQNFPSTAIPDILDVYKLFDRDPALEQINAHVVQRSVDPAIERKANEFYRDQQEIVRGIQEAIRNSIES